MKGIYKITSPNNSMYIGQSTNIEKRKKCYTPGRCTKQRLINNSLKKYGYKNHVFEILEILPEESSQNHLDVAEIKWFKEFQEKGFRMLNLKECGAGGGKHTEETKSIIGEQSKERFKSLGEWEIYQYDKNLILVKIWNDSILDIAKKGNFQSPSIGRSLEQNRMCNFKMAHNCFWFYKKDLENIQKIDKNRIVVKNNQYGQYNMYW